MSTKESLMEGKVCFADARDHCDWCKSMPSNKKHPWGWGACTKPENRDCPEDEE